MSKIQKSYLPTVGAVEGEIAGAAGSTGSAGSAAGSAGSTAGALGTHGGSDRGTVFIKENSSCRGEKSLGKNSKTHLSSTSWWAEGALGK